MPAQSRLGLRPLLALPHNGKLDFLSYKFLTRSILVDTLYITSHVQTSIFTTPWLNLRLSFLMNVVSLVLLYFAHLPNIEFSLSEAEVASFISLTLYVCRFHMRTPIIIIKSNQCPSVCWRAERMLNLKAVGCRTILLVKMSNQN